MHVHINLPRGIPHLDVFFVGLIKQFLRDVDWGDIDYLVVDTPPGTSDEHLSIVQYLSSTSVDGAVIITTPQEVALMDVRKEISFCRKVNLPVIGVVENMSGFVCPKCKVCVCVCVCVCKVSKNLKAVFATLYCH